ncbi:uncharacterized protein BJ171DRAFT_505858 [Polychytrium aggregatum]|uniref:uncharacterized protein n=1 Tax=Polychytrium aggregatum TaxID=110093 RepID=UPI0022FE9271|nr:uncharacterized protein BJ171DRAFT_505858 [Polychytrium aggregatum]KAI9204450.1 hypothetical protein BJ171DRAFT_505858 [Polychytrium aggregatum]
MALGRVAIGVSYRNHPVALAGRRCRGVFGGCFFCLAPSRFFCLAPKLRDLAAMLGIPLERFDTNDTVFSDPLFDTVQADRPEHRPSVAWIWGHSNSDASAPAVDENLVSPSTTVQNADDVAIQDEAGSVRSTVRSRRRLSSLVAVDGEPSSAHSNSKELLPLIESEPTVSFKLLVDRLLHNRKTWWPSRLLQTLFVLALWASVVTLCLTTVYAVVKDPRSQSILFAIDCVCTTIFILELVLNLAVVRSWADIFQWARFADMVSIIPFCVEIVVALVTGQSPVEFCYGWTSNNPVRPFRIMRVTKFFIVSSKLEFLVQALYNSRDGILALFYVLPIIILFFGTLVYYSDNLQSFQQDGIWYYSNGQPAYFQSIPNTFWFLIVTLTTIGYGDVVPPTLPGKLATTGAMVASLFVVAFPLTMITTQYTVVVRRFNQKQRQKRAEMNQRLEAQLRALAQGQLPYQRQNPQNKTEPAPLRQVKTTGSDTSLDDHSLSHQQSEGSATRYPPDTEAGTSWTGSKDASQQTHLSPPRHPFHYPQLLTALAQSSLKHLNHGATVDPTVTYPAQIEHGRTETASPHLPCARCVEEAMVQRLDAVDAPAKVHLRVAEWSHHVSPADEDVLTMRINISDPNQYRKLMRFLADL